MIDTACKISSGLSTDDQLISGTLSTGEIRLEATLNIGSGGRLPNYTGDYTVIPKVYEQTLETKNKSMTDDVTVTAVPYAEVSNPSGGLTANIAYIP